MVLDYNPGHVPRLHFVDPRVLLHEQADPCTSYFVHVQATHMHTYTHLQFGGHTGVDAMCSEEERK